MTVLKIGCEKNSMIKWKDHGCGYQLREMVSNLSPKGNEMMACRA